MKIAGRRISADDPPYIVAEISANHCGRLNLAKDHVLAAIKEAGADAVKIQCYSADEICAKSSITVKGGLWDGENLYELYKRAETPLPAAIEILDYAKSKGIVCFPSVFNIMDIDVMVAMGVPALKIASFEITDIPLITHAAATDLPIIMSLGTSPSRQQIGDAVAAVLRGRNDKFNDDLALLHCVSNYPAQASDANLPILGQLANLYGGKSHVVGFSDHTLGSGTACAAVAFGACIIEKHFILDRSLDSPDASFSLEPSEFSLMAAACRDAWHATRSHQSQTDCPDQAASFYRRSIWTLKNVASGEKFSPSNVGILRPASGLEPSLYGSVLAGAATRDLRAYTPLSSEMVSSLA